MFLIIILIFFLGVIQQFQGQCSQCRGSGLRRPQDRCKHCQGKRTTRERKVLEVNIEKGMVDGQKIVFSGEGDQDPDLQPGNIIIVLEELAHKVFQRRGQDLITKVELQIVESLCGFQKVINTLDNRDLLITSIPGEVIKHGDIRCIYNEGMPNLKDPFEKGRMVVQFSVQFPTTLPPSVIPMLENCLPPRPETMITDAVEECILEQYDPKEERGRYTNAYDEDDGFEGRGVQCAST